MTQLIRLTRDGNCVVIKEKFRYVLHKKIQEKKYHNFIFFSRDVLRLLLENLSDEVGSTRALVFGVLTEMLKQEPLISSFQGFTELIILKVLEAHRDDEKDVRSLIFRLFFFELICFHVIFHFFSFRWKELLRPVLPQWQECYLPT